MSFLIERAPTPLMRREQIVDMVTSRMKLSESHYMGIRQRLPRLYDLWRGVYTGRFHPHKNNVHLPLIYSACWSDAARKAATSLNTFPIVKFIGYGPDDEPIARKRESLISAQMSDMDMFLKQVDTFLVADLYGTAITQVMWRRTEEMRMIEETANLPLSGRIVRTIRKGKVISFDGPDIENVDRLDAFPAPGHKDIRKMPWFIRRYFLELDDVRGFAATGIFDKAEVQRMEREGGAGGTFFSDQALTRRFQVRSGTTDDDVRNMDRYSRQVEILEMWGVVPSELCDDGVLKRVVTIANRRYLFRNRPLPFWHNKIPMVTFSPTPDPHYFDAPGKAEIAEKLQITANRYVNQSLDAAELMIDPMWFYDRASNLNTRNLVARPGKFIPVDGDPSKVISPLMGNLNGLTVADKQVDMASRGIQSGTGMFEDTTQGGGGDSRQTAREFLGRREAAGTRLMLESMIYERGYLEPLTNMMVALDKQFLDTPVEVLILGDSAKLDPVTREPIMTSREQLDGYDLVPNYAARAVGATSALSQTTIQSNLMMIVQNISAFPQVMGAINMVNFWRGICRALEIPNVNEIFQENKNNPLLPFIQQANGGDPNAGNVPSTKQMVNGMAPQPLAGGGDGTTQGVDIASVLQGAA